MAAEKARVVICLFRNDLRYHDNQMLHWAHANGERILPLFCLDPVNLVRTWNFGFPKTGLHRLCFLLEAITDLRQKLKQHGSNLVVREGETAGVIRDLVTSLGTDNVQAVAFQKEVTKEEVDVEAAIKSDCKKCGIKVRTFWGLTLYHKEDLPFDPQQTPNVYTEFRKAVENRSSVRQMKEMPKLLKPFPEDIDEGAIPAYPDQATPPGDHDSRSAFPFSGGETSALGRLHYYLWESDKVERYKETRNGMIGPDYSTKFSPWLALGNLSPLKIYWEMKKYESERTANQSTYWVIFELLWRDYFKFVALKFGTRLFYKSGLLGKSIPWKIDMAMFHAWKDGRTGVPYVDANMRELKTTGFMSNRGRQNVASYLTKDLKLDWRLGAEWFESMLIDHDVCSNYGNWLYSAGIGNDPRQDRKFNMIKQGLDYDPNGDYVRLWVPELSAVKSGDVHRVWTLSQSQLSQAGVSIGETYPHPIVVAPEWGRHFSKSRGAGGRGGKGCDPAPTRRGVDFYFSSKPHNNQQ